MRRIGWLLALAAVAVVGLALPQNASAQVCNGAFEVLSVTGDNYGVPGSEYTITVGLGSGPITSPGGGTPGQLTVNRFRYNLDCAGLGSVDLCTDEGDIIRFVTAPSIPDPNDGGALKAIVGSNECQDIGLTPVDWSSPNAVDGPAGPNQVQIEPSAPVVFLENELPTDCTVTFKVRVETSPGTNGTPLSIQQAGGSSQLFPDWTCNNAAGTAAVTGSNSIELCEICSGPSECATFACDPNDPRPRSEGGGLCVPDFSTDLCRAATDVCDAPEFCTGSDPDCPADAKEPTTTECRASGGICDPAEFCDGTNDSCPADLKEPTTTECRASGGICDPAEFCDGTNDNCPADLKEPTTTQCRASNGICDPAEFCDGTNAGCPADAKEPTTTLCRASNGICDPAEFCDGTNDSCPADLKEPTTTQCRASNGICDPAEFCDGAGDSCPADAKEPSTTVCRPAVDVCDEPDLCDGVGDLCPADAKAPAGTVCATDADLCTAEQCDGAGACVPNPAGDVVCPPGTCYTETCIPATGLCGNRQCDPASNSAACQVVIGDCLWEDADGNGQQDGAETGIDGVTVSVFECSGAPILLDSQLSGGAGVSGACAAGQGGYGFVVDAVDPACEPVGVNLRISIDPGSLPLGLQGTVMDVGDDATDNDCNPATAMTVCTPFAAGEVNQSIDCGFEPAPPDVPAGSPWGLLVVVVLLLSGLSWRVARQG